MREIWNQLKPWMRDDTPFALATVVGAAHPSPRGIGAVMAIHADGRQFLGSVSAGCVEMEVLEAAGNCLRDGRTRHAEFGGEHGFPWEVSMSCGGKIRVRIDTFPTVPEIRAAFSEILNQEQAALHIQGPDALLLVREDGEIRANMGKVPVSLVRHAGKHFEAGLPTREVEHQGATWLFRRIERPARFFIVGAVHISVHLAGLAKTCGYETVVIDPREVYARADRFPTPPDQLIHGWPHKELERFSLNPLDCAAVITHDPKIDDDALITLLKSPCGYIGALGSRRNHAARLKRLAQVLPGADLSRIHGPIGLPIGSETPAEIAVSILAEVIRERTR